MTPEEKVELIKLVAASAIRNFNVAPNSITLDYSVGKQLLSYYESWVGLKDGMSLFGIELTDGNWWEYKGKMLVL